MPPFKPFASLTLALAVIGAFGGCEKHNSSANDSAAQSSTSSKTQAPRQLIESRESPYNNIYVYKDGPYVSMTFGVNQKIYTESLYNPVDELELPSRYTQFMTMALVYPNKVQSILEIGTGGGRTAWYLHHYLPEAKITSVELDPDVVDLGKKHFGIKEEQNFHLVTRDGRIFLNSSKEKFDVILIDAYRGPFVPFHLLTKEFYATVKAHLTQGGVLAQNIEPSTMLFDSNVNTIHEVFSQVEFYDAWEDDKGAGNIVLVAYEDPGPTDSHLKDMALQCETAYKLRYDPRQMLVRRFTLQKRMNGEKPVYDVVNAWGTATAGIDENAKVLTDDFAPVESLKAIEKHNQKWLLQPIPDSSH